MRACLAPSLALLVLAAASPARAVVVLEEHFSTDTQDFAGTYGWSHSYCYDNWRTDLNGGVIADRDDNCLSCGCNFYVEKGGDGCAYSDPFDDHVQTGNLYWQNYVYSVLMRNDDDDTMGVVFRYVDTADFYLFIVTLGNFPGPSSCEESGAGARLLRIYQGQISTLKYDAAIKYIQGVVHLVRITANGAHLKIDFDKNGDSFISPDEVFFDAPDNSPQALLFGRIGLYAFENGVQEQGYPDVCAGGGCWFDDVLVDLLPPNNLDCGDVTWEGKCDGNTVVFCDVDGHLDQQPCPSPQCCSWNSQEGYFACANVAKCGSSCTDDCSAGQSWCSANLTHRLVCGNADPDPCAEPLPEPCPQGTACNPFTTKCEGSCAPDCTGKTCGDDGCGSSCGECAPDEQCLAGICQSGCYPSCEGKECGDNGCRGTCGTCPENKECKAGTCKLLPASPCTAPSDCAAALCIHFQSGSFCTVPCSTDAGCPQAWHCSPWLDPNTPAVCAPASTITPYQTCAQVYDCVTSCPTAQLDCYSTCFFMAAPQARTAFAAYYNCLAPNCADCTDDECYTDCVINNCFQPYAQCFPGTSSCKDALDCIADCANVAACQKECMDEALPGAKMQLADLFNCVSQYCDATSGSDCFVAAAAGPCKDYYDSCLTQCLPFCLGYECGPDGCGGTCGTCPPNHACDYGTCKPFCLSDCDNRECGPDGCDGLCGTCQPPLLCQDGKCVEEATCTSHKSQQCVGDSLFWFDSCGKQEDLVKLCPQGCAIGACLGEPAADVLSSDAAGDTVLADEPITFTAREKSGGCSHADTPRPLAPLALLAAALLLPLTSRFRRHPHA